MTYESFVEAVRSELSFLTSPAIAAVRSFPEVLSMEYNQDLISWTISFAHDKIASVAGFVQAKHRTTSWNYNDHSLIVAMNDQGVTELARRIEYFVSRPWIVIFRSRTFELTTHNDGSYNSAFFVVAELLNRALNKEEFLSIYGQVTLAIHPLWNYYYLWTSIYRRAMELGITKEELKDTRQRMSSNAEATKLML